MRVSRREYLGLYIFAKPMNSVERDFNNMILQKAEAIRCLRVTSIINEQFDFLDKDKLRGDFLAYFKGIAKKKYDKWDAIYRHFSNFVRNRCTFEDVTVELCQKFRDYLLNEACSLSRPQFKLGNNSAAGYWSTFRGLLKIAYRDKMIRENINDYLDRIDTEDVKKEYLTADELKQLAKTPCKIPILKQASLFSCLTGLRLSDVINLKWEDIEIASDGEYCMRIRTQKTQTTATLPISDEALKLCGERSTGKVFKGFRRCMASYPLKQWLNEAGITKPISFHSFRHTYATLQIASGTDIYTVSKMLTHRNVTTTQIYADLVNEKKRATVNKISLE
jgi:integrase